MVLQSVVAKSRRLGIGCPPENLARLAAEFVKYIEQLREWDIHVA